MTVYTLKSHAIYKTTLNHGTQNSFALTLVRAGGGLWTELNWANYENVPIDWKRSQGRIKKNVKKNPITIFNLQVCESLINFIDTAATVITPTSHTHKYHNTSHDTKVRLKVNKPNRVYPILYIWKSCSKIWRPTKITFL